MKKTETSSKPTKRSTYRHGDLRRALLETAYESARVNGPNAIVLRELVRQVGVVPNAAYRHFADRQALLQEVSWAAQSACAQFIENELAGIDTKAGDEEIARAKLRAVGAGYIHFARKEPGLFRTAFSVPADLDNAANPASAGESGLTPFQLLSQALDGLVSAGVLSHERRQYAEFLAWSAVHGFAMLVLDGPLRALPETHMQLVGQRLLEMVERGL